MIDEAAVQEAARYAMNKHYGKPVADCIAATLQAAIKEMVAQANAHLKNFQEIK